MTPSYCKSIIRKKGLSLCVRNTFIGAFIFLYSSSISNGSESENTFEARKTRLIENVANHRLDKWREGYFKGNDPGKYLLGSAMAKLLLDKADPDAIRLMNDARAPLEHYHFAAVNWARFLPLFKDVISEETLKTYTAKAATYGSYLNPSGTENHRVMEWSSGGVIPHFLDTKTFGGRPKEEAAKISKEHVRRYVKGLYAAGQGEWDSSTYLLFDLNGLLNLYDFSPDPEVRAIADAGLRWLVAGYALKYRDGMYAAPGLRGFTSTTAAEITDQTGWLWWGSQYSPTDEELRGFLYSIHAATSQWRPGPVLDAIAQKTLPDLPVTYTATKPNYWHGQRLEPRAGAYHETVHIAPTFTLGSLANNHGGQITRWELIAETPNGPVNFWGGHPRKSDHVRKKIGIGYTDGIGRYDQLGQVDSTLLHITDTPQDEETQWSFFAYRDGSYQTNANGWYTFKVGETVIAIYPLAENVTFGHVETSLSAAGGRRPKGKQPVLKLHGLQNGFVLEIGEDLDPSSLSKPEWHVDEAPQIRYTKQNGQRIDLLYQPEAREAQLYVDDILQTRAPQPIYDSPHVYAESGVLRVSNGIEGFQIDFRGELPVFSDLK